MPRDRDDYRSMSSVGILKTAREEGIDPEMAIVLAEKLAAQTWAHHEYGAGCFRFNHKETNNA